MIWHLEWHPAAIRGFHALPMRSAERLDAAVIRFAETSRGPVTRLYPHHPRLLQLVVPGAIALLYADERAGVLRVGRVFARSA